MNIIIEHSGPTWTPVTPISVMSSVNTPGSLSAESFSCLIYTENAMLDETTGNNDHQSFTVQLHLSLTD